MHRPPVATGVRLDQDLPAPALVTGVTGLDDVSALNRAEGALIDQGVDADDVAAQLLQRAAAARLDPGAYARQLLAGLLAGR